MNASTPATRLRLAFVLWSGRLGGAETYVASLVNVLRTAEVDAQVVFVGGDEPLSDRLARAGIPFVALGLERGRAALWHPRLFASAVGRVGLDGVVLPANDFLALALRLGRYRGRIVGVEHGSLLHTDVANRRPGWVGRLDNAIGNRFVDVHVAVSDFLGARMRRPSVTIPNGVDLELYRPMSAAGAGAPFTIGCVSRLVRGKGVEDVLSSAAPAIARGARLEIAGDGPNRRALEQQAEQLGIRENVSFEGWLADAGDIVRFWAACDVAITAPNDLVESFGLSAVEAMACGRPVVATRVGGLADVVADGQTGFLESPRNTDVLAARLLTYMDDRRLTATHGAAARERCEQRFDIRRSAAAYTRLFGSAAQ